MRLAVALALALALVVAAAAAFASRAPRQASTASNSVPAPASASTRPDASPAPGVVSGEVARQLVLGGARVVDVRTPAEFAAGHVPGALNIPFDEIGRRAVEVGDPGDPVVLYCRTGRRSGLAAATLRGLGFSRTYDLQRHSNWPASAQ